MKEYNNSISRKAMESVREIWKGVSLHEVTQPPLERLLTWDLDSGSHHTL